MYKLEVMRDFCCVMAEKLGSLASKVVLKFSCGVIRVDDEMLQVYSGKSSSPQCSSQLLCNSVVSSLLSECFWGLASGPDSSRLCTMRQK